MVPRALRSGFTLIELLVVCSAIALLTAFLLPALTHVGTRARASKCLNNLKQLGTGTSIYLSDMNERLPYGSLRTSATTGEPSQVWSWDDLLHPYIGGSLNTKQLGQDAIREGDSSLEILACPSDHSKPSGWQDRPAKRSYAMTRHQMTTSPDWSFMTAAQAWPPHSADRTGIGLNWDLSQSMSAGSLGWNSGDLLSGTSNPQQATVKLSLVFDSANTILLSERISGANVQGNDREATIINAASHVGARDQTAEQFHDGFFNYLMIDGHVEHLRPQATLGTVNQDMNHQSGMWTIAADD